MCVCVCVCDAWSALKVRVLKNGSLYSRQCVADLRYVCSCAGHCTVRGEAEKDGKSLYSRQFIAEC